MRKSTCGDVFYKFYNALYPVLLFLSMACVAGCHSGSKDSKNDEMNSAMTESQKASRAEHKAQAGD
jgi:hypothetical protein